MGHPSSNAVMDFVRVTPRSLQYRLGLRFRLPGERLSGSLPTEQKVHIQIASPLPDRLNGRRWYDDLQVTGDGAFDRDDPAWRRLGVSATEDATNLLAPEEPTLIFNAVITVPLVQSDSAEETNFTLLRMEEPVSAAEAPNFLSVPYPAIVIGGRRLREAGVTYYIEGTLDFSRNANSWIAVSLDKFHPADRQSADYIAPVDPE